MRFLLCPALLIHVTGCGLVPQPCTLEFIYGVIIIVTDERGDAIQGATATLTEGTYSETMEARPTGFYVGAGERAGMYSLTVEADGYETATIDEIVVEADECHVMNEFYVVALEPE